SITNDVNIDNNWNNSAVASINTNSNTNTDTNTITNSCIKSLFIPNDFLMTDNIHDKIPPQICQFLNIKNEKINFINFRKILLVYINDNNMYDKNNDSGNKIIKLIEPLLYNGTDSVNLNEIN